MNDRQSLPETLDTVQVLTAVAQVFDENFNGESVRHPIEAAAERCRARLSSDARC